MFGPNKGWEALVDKDLVSDEELDDPENAGIRSWHGTSDVGRRGMSRFLSSRGATNLTAFVLASIANCIYQNTTVRDETVCVVDKGIDIRTSLYEDRNGDTQVVTRRVLMVYGSEGTFENRLALWRGKFGSEDLQGRITEGRRYIFKVYGWDLPGDLTHPNILEIREDLGTCNIE